MKKYRIGIIGYGNMGRGYVQTLLQSPHWEVAAICDARLAARESARRDVPGALICEDTETLFSLPNLDAVGLFTLADARPAQIRRALSAGLHILAEKPIAADVATEKELLAQIEASGKLVAVNLFNRNAWYHKAMQQFIAEGEIGKLGILRVCHETAGLLPGEGHAPEGPPFHDCGMHYVDVARWYSGSEYKCWNAQGVRMWGEAEPWWVSAHGEFENGVVFQITQGFVFGQGAQEKTQSCSFEAVGTQGVVTMRHNFEDVTLEMHGRTKTIHKSGPYGGKKLDVMVEVLANSIAAGKNLGFPEARDSVIASQISQQMHDAAAAQNPPSIGTPAEAEALLQRRRNPAKAA
jgi:myo-inositol 2-dehydrogenase/D-chiro-inositol 1-dehydrogenase